MQVASVTERGKLARKPDAAVEALSFFFTLASGFCNEHFLPSVPHGTGPTAAPVT